MTASEPECLSGKIDIKLSTFPPYPLKIQYALLFLEIGTKAKAGVGQ